MPEVPIMFGNIQESGNAELAGASPLAINVLVDGRGSVRRRPGLSTWSGFPEAIPDATQIDGIHAFDGDIYYVTDTRRIHKISGGAHSAMTDGTFNSYLAGTQRPVFADTPWRLVIAGGGALEKVDDGDVIAERLGGSPPNCNSVCAIANRLFIDDNTSNSTIGHIRASGLGTTGNESFDALDYVVADARTDDIVALRENTNEVFAFGATSLQVFSPDSISILAPGRTRNIGCAAAHSVVRIDDAFAWLDNQRQFRLSDGRGDEVISDPIAETLDGIATVSDCYGFRINTGQFDCVVWVFPTDGRSFCWERNGGWSQWHGWSGGFHSLLPIKAHFYDETNNLHLAGLATGQIVKVDTEANTDLGDTVKAEVLTGFISRETDAVKQCHAIRFTVKRGQASTEPVLRLSWRDDLGRFCQPLNIRLGTSGDYLATVEKRGLGAYRRRQWKLEFDANAELLVAGVTEVFSVGSN